MNDEYDSIKEPADDWELSMKSPEQTAPVKFGGKNSPPDEADSSAAADDWEVSPASAPEPEQADDWGMTNPLKPVTGVTGEGGWQLPKPVFRSSEGYTPKKFVENSPFSNAKGSMAETESAVPDDFSIMEAPPMPANSEINEPVPKTALPLPDAPSAAEKLSPPPSAFAAAVEPQPDIAEAFVAAPSVAAEAKAVKPPNKTLRIISIAAGLLAMLGFIVGFLVLIYYLFFKGSSGE